MVSRWLQFSLLGAALLLFPLAGRAQEVTAPGATDAPVWVPHEGGAVNKVVTLDIRKVNDFYERCLLASAEGLINSEPKDHSKVYLIWDDSDIRWLSWLQLEHAVSSITALKSEQDLINMCPTKKAVVWDEKPFEMGDIATTIAGCKRELLVGDPTLLKTFGLKQDLDLRGKFKTDVEAYDWLIAHYGKDLNPKAVSMTVPYQTQEHNPANLRDYLVADKIFTFWIAGSKEANMAGADTASETSKLQDILVNKFSPNMMCLGYPWSGDGYGPGEGPGITFLSQCAKWLVATDNFHNLSFWTLFPPSDNKMPKSPPAPVYQRGKKYAAIVMSDGDNACTFQQFFPDYWQKLQAGIPVGWTVAPVLQQLAPPIYDYVTGHIPVGSSVGTGVSGIGYMTLQEWGKAYGAKQQAIIDGFMAQTQQACALTGEKWLWIMRFGGPDGKGVHAYAEKVGGISAIMGGYGPVTDDPKLADTRIGNVGVFNCFIPGGNFDELSKNFDTAITTPGCPDFINLFCMNWNFAPADMEKLAAYVRSKGVILVTPEQLSLLQAQKIAMEKISAGK